MIFMEINLIICGFSPSPTSGLTATCHSSDYRRFASLGSTIVASGRRMLFTSLKNVFKRVAIVGSASVTKQFNRHGWSREQEGDQDCSEAKHCRPHEIRTGMDSE